MKDREKIQRYINDFRRHLSRLVREGMGVSCRAFPTEGPGALLEFTISPGIPSGDQIMETKETVNKALLAVPQRAFGGDLTGLVFSGTNLIAEDNRIILVKGEDSDESWNDADAKANVDRIIEATRNRPK